MKAMHRRLIAASAMLCAAATSAAAGLEPTKVEQLVTLIAGQDSPSCGTLPNSLVFGRLLPDGSQEPFVIPPKTAFVVTGGSLFVINGATNINDFAQVVITDQAVTTASLVAAVLFRPDPGGDGAESFDTQSGHVIPANMQLCASHNVAADVFGGLVRGYLTKAR
jgi:hypothetical protein